ncbi:MAG: sulfurtransferase [Myxococcales bacterium]|nr:sulfurtransferase [Myxococcales bacterium]
MNHSPEFLALVEDAKHRVPECTLDELARWRADGKEFRLIDVREDDEWRAGHAEGAEHLGRGVLERDIVGQVPVKETTVVLYCGGGFRSALAADNLQRMGYTAVWSLAGGWKAWVAAGLPQRPAC